MEKTSVTVRGKAAPMIALLGTVFVVLLVAPITIQYATPKEMKVARKAQPLVGEPVYADYVKATALLKEGKGEAARQLIDRQQEAVIAITPNGAMSGPLANCSSASLLFGLVKAMAQQASRVAWEGDSDNAQAWVSRCRMLSHQALCSTAPTLDALQLAGAIDRVTLETQARVLFALGDTAGAQKQREQVEAFDRYWKSHMLAVVREERYKLDSFRLSLKQDRVPSPEDLEERERNFAIEMTARYIKERRRMGIA